MIDHNNIRNSAKNKIVMNWWSEDNERVLFIDDRNPPVQWISCTVILTN